MNQPHRRLTIILASFLCASIAWLAMDQGSPAADEPAPIPTQTWEYKFKRRLDESEANKMGAEGWELCTATSLDDPVDSPSTMQYIFKRPIR